MGQQGARTVLRHLRKLVAEPGISRRLDQQLLRQFVARRDESAFAELVRRHGPMVLDAARSILHNLHDAEDVFQATFLVLARKAGSIRKQTSLASWIYGVAYRLALKARTGTAKRRAREQRAIQPCQTSAMDEMTWRELRLVLHEELHRLPAKYQAPLILCYFEGKTQDEAAEQLGWNKWTLKDRLEQGRDLLRKRLTRRGLIPSTALFATLLWQSAASAIPTALLNSTLNAGMLLATGQATTAAISAQTARLVEQGIRSLAITKGKIAMAMILTFGMIVAGAGLAAYQAAKDEPPPEKKEAQANLVADNEQPLKPQKERQPRTDRYGDPLPRGAIARLGTLRFRVGSQVHAVAFSPDGKTIASGADDSTLRLWDAKSGKELRRFAGNRGGVYCVAFSPDGQTLASGSLDQSVRLWDVASGKEIRRFDGHQHGVHSLAFSPDGKTLASGSDDKTIRLWEVKTGKEIRQLNGHEERIGGIAFSPDGEFLASSGYDKTVRLWEVATGKEISRVTLDEASFALAFLPNGKTLAAGVGGKGVGLWEVDSGRKIGQLAVDGWLACLAFSPDGKILAAGSTDRLIRLWEVATWKEVGRYRGHQLHVKTIAFSPDGKTLASGGADQTIRLWDIATGKEIQPFGGHQGAVSSVAFSAGRKLLASGGGDHTVRLWDVPAGHELRHFPEDQDWIKTAAIRLFGLLTGKELRIFGAVPYWDWIQTVAFSPDDKMLVSGGADGTIHSWDAATGKELRRFERIPAWISQLVFSPDGKLLASLREQGELIDVWDIKRGKKVRQLGGPGRFPAVAFSLDGKVVASGCKDRFIRLWEVSSGKEINHFGGHECEIRALVYSPDGKTLISSDGNNQNNVIHIWEAASGKEVGQLKGMGYGVISLAISRDGQMLAAGHLGSDVICLWELRSRQECSRFVGVGGALRSLSLPMARCWPRGPTKLP